ncbi:hypothetical protein [Streptomyces sp. NPDC059402]|uniref:hypothetical protein n=1 Tax=Streptomyces sp. NPDC059402 TaxID=3346822 RepID=UPI0036ABE3B4
MGVVSTEGATAISIEHPSELPGLVGTTFTTPWFRVDEDRLTSFEHASYHEEYPHGYGGEEGYGEGLVEGFHLLSLLDVLGNHAFWVEGPWLAWNYGLDRVRFISPVRTTDHFRVHGVVREVTERDNGGFLVVTDLRAEVKDREKPGFIATQRALWTTV